MFGYVVPLKDELKISEYEAYKSVYCGLCRETKRHYGNFARMFLSYDFVFLALYLENLGGKPFQVLPCRCILHPLKKCPVAKGDAVLFYVSSVGVLLSYQKLKDNIADEQKLISRLLSRVCELLLRRAYKKAVSCFPACDEQIRGPLFDLLKIEENNTVSIDEPADTFARLLRDVSSGAVEDEKQKLVTGELFKNIGRWIYLMDAYTDLSEDLKNGSYNPILLRYSYNGDDLDAFKEGIREDLSFTLTQSLANAAKAYELLPAGLYSGILGNILYLGLSSRQRRTVEWKRGEENGSV